MESLELNITKSEMKISLYIGLTADYMWPVNFNKLENTVIEIIQTEVQREKK